MTVTVTVTVAVAVLAAVAGAGMDVAAGTHSSRRMGPSPRQLGPATPEDAWKWEGVPEGYTLLDPVIPGKTRHCGGDDGHGPQLKALPAAWPPGEGPDGEGGAGGGGEP